MNVSYLLSRREKIDIWYYLLAEQQLAPVNIIQYVYIGSMNVEPTVLVNDKQEVEELALTRIRSKLFKEDSLKDV